MAAGFPHHVTQRGNRRLQTFFCEEDYRCYVDLMAASCERLGVEVWAYCLMPNHVHLVAVPDSEDGLRRAIGDAHRRYSRRINFREGWRGHLWQGRFPSFAMDERYLLAAAPYIERNPVRARLVEEPAQWPLSSARAHLAGRDDALAKASPLLEMVGEWAEFLSREPLVEEAQALRRHEETGRPLGGGFLERLENSLSRPLRPRKRGPKRRRKGS